VVRVVHRNSELGTNLGSISHNDDGVAKKQKAFRMVIKNLRP
jgi:hypothetical protein